MFISKKKYNKLVKRVEQLEENSILHNSRIKNNEKSNLALKKEIFELNSNVNKIKAAAKEVAAKITLD